MTKRQELIDFLTWYREGSIIYDACGIEIVADQYLADHQQVERSCKTCINSFAPGSYDDCKPCINFDGVINYSNWKPQI